MIVTYFGDRCFRLQSGDTSLLVDPTSNRFKADVVLKTLVPTTMLTSSPEEILCPGEYDIKGMEVHGFPIPAESDEKLLKTVFSVQWEDMRFVFLGHLANAPDAELVGKVGEADVLFFPLDGDHYLSPDAASKLIKQISPHIAIASFSKNPSALVKTFGQKTEVLDKLVFKKKDILGDQDRIVILKNG